MISTAQLELHKYHGLANDFLVVVDDHRSPACFEGYRRLGPDLARAVCERHRGVGGDGLILLERSKDGTITMVLWNADGSRAETSGNGLRCAGLAAHDLGLVDTPSFRLTTDAGGARVTLQEPGGGGSRSFSPRAVVVEMGVVSLGAAIEPARIDEALGFDSPVCLGAIEADVGNPHLVIWLPSLEAVDIGAAGSRLGRALSCETNIEIVSLSRERDDVIELVVFERGVGPTAACGSGSCAAAAALALLGAVGTDVTVANPGGELFVGLRRSSPRSYDAVLEGPAVRVARIVVELAAIAELLEGAGTRPSSRAGEQFSSVSRESRGLAFDRER
jgi:diaminopimelate epimerase